MPESKLITWSARATLLVLLIYSTWLATRPNYSLSPWMPYDLMRWAGLPYAALLWLDHHVATMIHFVVALIGTSLLYYSALPYPQPLSRISGLLCSALVFVLLAIALEIVQIYTGRGFGFFDLLAGVAGAGLAYLVLRKLGRDPV